MSDITRVIIKTIISNKIQEIKDSPKRSIRNLVDLGLNFFNGRFQKLFLETTQTMLKNEQSPYYDLIQDKVYHTNSERLISFGLNIGYNSCTVGAKKIREIEAEDKFNIPWSISLEINETNFEHNKERYLSIIEQGENLGIYTWFIYPTGETFNYLALAREYPNSAFIIFCSVHSITESFLENIDELNNVMIVVKYEENIEDICEHLRKRELLYSIYFPYSEDDVDAILDGEIIEDIVEMHPAFTMLMPTINCSKEVRKKIYEYVIQSRKEQRFQTILWDIVSDSCFVDSVISEDYCFAGFDKAGNLYTITGNKQDEKNNIFNNKLIDIFKLAFFKK